MDCVFCRFYLTTRGQSTERVVFNQTEANIDNPQLVRKVRVLELTTNSEFALMCRSFRQVFKLHRKRVKVCKFSHLRIAYLTILRKPESWRLLILISGWLRTCSLVIDSAREFICSDRKPTLLCCPDEHIPATLFGPRHEILGVGVQLATSRVHFVMEDLGGASQKVSYGLRV